MQRMRGNTVPLVVAGAGLGYWLWSRQYGRRVSSGTERTHDAFDRSWSEAEGYGADAGSYRVVRPRPRLVRHRRDRRRAGQERGRVGCRPRPRRGVGGR